MKQLRSWSLNTRAFQVSLRIPHGSSVGWVACAASAALARTSILSIRVSHTQRMPGGLWGHSDVPALQSHSDTGRPCSVGSKSSRPCRRTSPAPAGDNGSEQLRRPAAARQRLPHQFFGWAVALLFRFGSTSRCWPLLLIQLFPPGTKDSTVRPCHQAATQKGN